MVPGPGTLAGGAAGTGRWFPRRVGVDLLLGDEIDASIADAMGVAGVASKASGQ